MAGAIWGPQGHGMTIQVFCHNDWTLLRWTRLCRNCFHHRLHRNLTSWVQLELQIFITYKAHAFLGTQEVVCSFIARLFLDGMAGLPLRLL